MPLEDALEKIRDGSLVKLDLGTLDNDKKIGTEGAERLAIALRSPSNRLAHLKLWNNNIDLEGVTAIAGALPNSTMLSLNLAGNNIGDEGIVRLVSVLAEPSCRLVSLTVTHNHFGDIGATALATVLKKFTSLSMGGNDFSDASGETLASAIKEPNCKLICLDLSNTNYLRSGGVNEILNAIKISNVPLLYCILGYDKEANLELATILERNRASFVSICNDILNDLVVTSQDKERIFLQGHAILNAERILCAMIPSPEMERLASSSLQKLQLEYDAGVSGCLVDVLPSPLSNIILSYIQESDSQLYVSFCTNADDIASQEDGREASSLSFSHSRKRKVIPVPMVAQKKSRVAVEDETVAPSADGDDADSMVSAQPCSSHDALAQGGERVSNSAGWSLEQSDKGQPPIWLRYATTYDGSTINTNQQISLQACTGKANTIEELLITLFTWLKDLPEEMQAQIIASSTMKPVLEMIENIVQPNKFIVDQLFSQAIEESFSIEYKNHYGQDDSLQANSQAETQVSQYDSLVALDETVGTIYSDGVLIDHLPKYDINFGAPHILGGLASL